MVKTKEELKASDFKFGKYEKSYKKNENGTYEVSGKYYCSCGTCGFLEKKWKNVTYSCQKCGNELFTELGLSVNSVGTFPSIKVIESTDRKIAFSRQNVSVIFDASSKDLFHFRRKGVARTVELDMIEGELNVYREDAKSKRRELAFKQGEMVSLDEDVNVNNSNVYRQIKKIQSLILREISKDTLINMITNQNTRYLLLAFNKKFNYKYRNQMNYYYYSRNDNPLGALCFMTNESTKIYQTLATAGVPQAVDFPEKHLNLDETKPHKILGVNKKFMRWFKMNDGVLGENVLEIGKFMSRFDSNFTDEVLTIIQDESNVRKFSQSLDQLEYLMDSGYSDFKALVLYLSRHCRMHQGIDLVNASTYLRDYVRIQRGLGLEFEKYPKSLKKVHDVAVMNNNVLNNSGDDEKFKQAVSEKSYLRLVFENKKEKFIIAKPDKIDDLKREGEELTHCVASYVDDVQRGNCKILFLREKDNPDVPLVTIEVRGQRIRQARIKGNLDVSQEQREFIKLWSKEKNLIESYY